MATARVNPAIGQQALTRITSGILTILLLALFACDGSGTDQWTESYLAEAGIEPLNDAALTQLIVGNQLTILNRESGEAYRATFREDGRRVIVGLDRAVTTQELVQAFHGGGGIEGVASYEIANSKILTSFGSETFEAKVYSIDDDYFGARSQDGGQVLWQLIESSSIPVGPMPRTDPQAPRSLPVAAIPDGERVTLATLAAYGAQPLDRDELTELVVGRTLTVWHRTTGAFYRINFGTDGMREVENMTARAAGEFSFVAFHGGPRIEPFAAYLIEDTSVRTILDHETYEITVYKVEEQHFAHRSGDGVMVNYEIIFSQGQM